MNKIRQYIKREMNAISGARIDSGNVIFPNREKAEEALKALEEAADEGETYEIKSNPIPGKKSCIIFRYYKGKFEGYF